MKPRTIEYRDVAFGYARQTPILTGLTLHVEAGLTLVLGPNGSGKSSLLKLAAGVEKPDSGTVLVDGHDLWSEEVLARRDLAYVPEQPDVTPYASVESVLRLVCRLRKQPFQAGLDALAILGLDGLGGRSIRELSKGQRNRVLLAAARVGMPRTLLLDEPLDGLDRGMRLAILEWIHEVCRSGGLALVVTHDIEPFAATATRVLAMHEGREELIPLDPHDHEHRLDLLESYARGEWPRR